MHSIAIDMPVGGMRSHSYEQVKISGAFIEKYFRVFAGKPGYYFVQPMRLHDGRYVLVNRGTFLKDEHLYEHTEKVVDLTGILYCDRNSRVKWVAANDADQNMWFWFDISSMSKHIGLPLEECIVWSNTSAAPMGLQPNSMPKIRNDHLEYAVTWYVLSVVWVCGYLVYFRQKALGKY